MTIINRMIATSILLMLPLTEAMATSKINANIRLFEDTISFIAFLLMMIAGLSLRKLNGASGYWILALAGLTGLIWKGIGVVKRITGAKEPVWLFDGVRETAEGLSGVVLALACILLVVGLRKLYKNT